MALDGATAVLLIVGLAYWWLGNAVHEIAGITFFCLLVLHTVLNRRWWGGLGRGSGDARRIGRVGLNLRVAGVVLALGVTSVLISETALASCA